jgi:hypothetical protein
LDNLARMNHIEIDVIPNEAQRYPTVGDYYEAGFNTFFKISALGDARMEFLVSIHEQIEQFLCKVRGISEPNQIKPFDEEFERNRQPGNVDEPGHDPSAPYHREHVFAEKIEMQIADELGVDWGEYSNRVNAL